MCIFKQIKPWQRVSNPLAFCDECGSLRLRDVTEQLQKLFINRIAKCNECGICKRSLGESTSQDLKKSKSAEQNESDLFSTETVQQTDKCTSELYVESVDGGAENQEVNNKLCVKVEHKIHASDASTVNCITKEDKNRYESVYGMSKAAKNQAKNQEVKDKLHQKVGKNKQKKDAANASKVNGKRKMDSDQFEPVQTRKRTRLSTGALTAPTRIKSVQTRIETVQARIEPVQTRIEPVQTRRRTGALTRPSYRSITTRTEDGESSDALTTPNYRSITTTTEEDDDSDYNPDAAGDDMSDNNEQNEDIDLSQYIVKDEKSHDANELNKKRIEYLVPELRELLIPSHDPQQLFKCKFCSATFGGQLKFQRHVVSHTGKELIKMPYACPDCGKKCPTLARCLQHKLCHGNKHEFMYKCTYTGLQVLIY